MTSIIKATIKDIPHIQRIARGTWPAAYSHLISQAQIEYMLELMYNTEELTRQIEGVYTFLLAVVDGEPIGFAGFSPYEDEDGKYKLHKLYVLPTTQKTGAGKELLQATEDAAKANNAHTLLLTVNKNNNATSFYNRMGFETTKSVTTDIGEGYVMDDYIMEKKLS